MPYALTFVKAVTIAERELYINGCCIGGDQILAHLLPSLKQRYGDLEMNQEDWGWFVWFGDGEVQLAVDVFADDAERGDFQLRLTSRTKRWLRPAKVHDTPELERLRDIVVGSLRAWPVAGLTVERVDER